MKLIIKTIAIILLATSLYSCNQPSKTTTTTRASDTTAQSRIGKATREDKNGWIYLHLYGSPADIGYQHGYLAAKEIDTLIKVMQYYLPSNG
ncbi:MAG TPA: hypothetical protein VGI43_00800, partial [Mucilaginibacter sp.]